jgi:hypothetical protein
VLSTNTGDPGDLSSSSSSLIRGDLSGEREGSVSKVNDMDLPAGERQYLTMG